MAARKSIVKDRAGLANLVTKLEETKKQATVNAIRQAFKRLVHVDAEARLRGDKSVLSMLARESAAIVKGEKARINAKARALRKKKKVVRKKK